MHSVNKNNTELNKRTAHTITIHFLQFIYLLFTPTCCASQSVVFVDEVAAVTICSLLVLTHAIAIDS